VETLYAVCPVCDAVVVDPSCSQARVDQGAQLHARVTGHPVDVLEESDPDEVRYVVSGEPGLFPVGPGLR
jgi:hypothetical protein